MKTWRPLLAMTLLAALFVAGALYLFGIQFSAGGVYPEYSTLRSDPMGAKLLYDALARLPDAAVERNFQPFEFLPDSGFTLVMLAVKPDAFANEQPYLHSIETIAARGNRVVVALAAADKIEPKDTPALLEKWGVRLGVDSARDASHRLYFAEAKGWNGVERVGPSLLAIQRNFGKGSVALLATSADFDNASTVTSDRLRLVAAALGPAQRVIFDEHHLGIAESGSVVALARRFRLTGLAIGLALCAALFLWRNGAAFPPPETAPEARPLEGRTAQAGLATLLRRYIPARELAAVCWREWLNGNRGAANAQRLRRAEAIAAGADEPLAALREIEIVLHAKGEL
jgi:hypothetical protein